MPEATEDALCVALTRLYKAVLGHATVGDLCAAEGHPDNAVESELIAAICQAEEALGLDA